MLGEKFSIQLTVLGSYRCGDILLTVGEFQTNGKGLYTLIWKKVAGKWKLLLDFNF